MGLFEYEALAFGLKGAPPTFQVGINPYLQSVLGQGFIAHLGGDLIYTPGLSTHASLQRRVLSILLKHQFYPSFRKCKFAKQELRYFGYMIIADGTAANKINAIRV